MSEDDIAQGIAALLNQSGDFGHVTWQGDNMMIMRLKSGARTVIEVTNL